MPHSGWVSGHRFRERPRYVREQMAILRSPPASLVSRPPGRAERSNDRVVLTVSYGSRSSTATTTPANPGTGIASPRSGRTRSR